MTENIRQRLQHVRDRIATACAEAGRSTKDVTLVAVSKTKPAEAIYEAYLEGQRDFGENYAQELTRKATELAELPDIRWHFIGPLQRNKVKFVAPHVSLLHSVDSVPLVEKLQVQAERFERKLSVLAQVNLSQEASKSGVDEGGLEMLLQTFAKTDRVECVGLMTIPAPGQDPTPCFSRLRQLRETYLTRRLPGVALTHLSMGMTADLEAAISLGATYVRVGTAIFGERPYTKR